MRSLRIFSIVGMYYTGKSGDKEYWMWFIYLFLRLYVTDLRSAHVLDVVMAVVLKAFFRRFAAWPSCQCLARRWTMLTGRSLRGVGRQIFPDLLAMRCALLIR